MPMPDDLLKYQIAITLLPGVGFANAKTLISKSGGLLPFFNSDYNSLKKIDGIGEITVKKIIAARPHCLKRAEEELEFIRKNKIQTYFYKDDDYPFLLKECKDSPLLLFSKGKINRMENRKIISIVGTRKASNYGKSFCESLIKDLAESNLNPIIISGLAYGIDICAHRAALKHQLDTLAVFGHGLDRLYPQAHRDTAREILTSGGALISEFLSQMKFQPQNFLQRNRIIAGMSKAVIVIESAAKGGALTTANIANSYNREVFALPGRATDEYSEGCNALIKNNQAILLQSYKDLEYFMNWDTPDPGKQLQLFQELSEDEKHMVEILKSEEQMPIDKICKLSKFNMSRVSSLLLEMEFKEIVRSSPGKIFSLSNKNYK